MCKLLLSLAISLLCVPALAQGPDEQLAAASALFDAGKYSEAVVKLDAFIAANPTHPKVGAAALALGRARTELKQWPQAVQAYERARDVKDPAITPKADLLLGEAAVNAQQYDKAAAALQDALKEKLTPEQTASAWYLLAQADFQLKKYDAAQDAYDRVTKDFATSDFVDDAYYGAGLAALRQAHADAARQRLQVVVDRYRSSEDRPQALLLLAQMDMDAKRYPQARAGFESLLRDYPGTTDLQSTAEDGLIQALLELNDFAAVIPRLQSAIGKLPAGAAQKYRAELSLGHAYFRQKQYDQALAAYQAAEKSPDDTVSGEAFYWAANTYLAMNRPDDAAPAFAQVCTKTPQHPLAPKAQVRSGDAYLAAKQPEAAVRAYKAAVDHYGQTPQADEARKALAALTQSITDPAQLAAVLQSQPTTERAQGTLRLARLYIGNKKYAEAVQPLADLLHSNPEQGVAAEANYLLGLAMEGQDRPAAAVAAYEEAFKLSMSAPWAADAQGRLAWLYLALKRPADAETAASVALASKLDPQAERQARLALVQALLDQEKWDGALEGAKTLLAGNPGPDVVATVLFTEASVYEKKGKPEDAEPIWERIHTEFPKCPYAPQALLHQGDARFKDGKYDEARDKYQALLKEYPNSAVASEGRFKLGSALYSLNKYPEAAREFDTVAQNKDAGEWQPESLYWAGVALENAGKKDDAIQRFERLIAEHPSHARVPTAKVRLAALKAVK